MRAIMGAILPRRRRSAMIAPMHGLVEREWELAALDGLIARARDGVGGAIFVEGEPGAGKTSLLGDVGAAGMRVLRAVADGEESEVPLAAARVLLARAAVQ